MSVDSISAQLDLEIVALEQSIESFNDLSGFNPSMHEEIKKGIEPIKQSIQRIKDCQTELKKCNGSEEQIKEITGRFKIELTSYKPEDIPDEIKLENNMIVPYDELKTISRVDLAKLEDKNLIKYDDYDTNHVFAYGNLMSDEEINEIFEFIISLPEVTGHTREGRTLICQVTQNVDKNYTGYIIRELSRIIGMIYHEINKKLINEEYKKEITVTPTTNVPLDYLVGHGYPCRMEEDKLIITISE